MTIMQGDAYPLYFQILTKDEKIVTGNDVSAVEVMIGSFIRYYPKDIVYDTELKCFVLSLTQKDTFQLTVGTQTLQFRIKDHSENVRGWYPGDRLTVRESKSKVIL